MFSAPGSLYSLLWGWPSWAEAPLGGKEPQGGGIARLSSICAEEMWHLRPSPVALLQNLAGTFASVVVGRIRPPLHKTLFSQPQW